MTIVITDYPKDKIIEVNVTIRPEEDEEGNKKERVNVIGFTVEQDDDE